MKCMLWGILFDILTAVFFSRNGGIEMKYVLLGILFWIFVIFMYMGVLALCIDYTYDDDEECIF